MAAPAGDLPSDFNDTEGFDEYDPDPYDGGYDIAATYGHPLPPSPATCYPLAAAVAETLKEAPFFAAKEALKEAPKEAAPAPAPAPSYVYGPDLPTRHCCWRRHFERFSLPRWAADYLFDYLPYYGAKRDETQRYGNLNYAYDRHTIQQPITVTVDPNVSSGDGGFYQDQWYGSSPVDFNAEGKNWVGELRYNDGPGWFGGESCREVYEEGIFTDKEYGNAYEKADYGQDCRDVYKEGIFSTTEYVSSYEKANYGVNSVSVEFEPAESREIRYHDEVHKEEEYVNAYENADYGQNCRDVYKEGIFSTTEYVSSYEKANYGVNSVSVEFEPAEPREIRYHDEVHKEEEYPISGYTSSYRNQVSSEPFSVEFGQAERLEKLEYHENYVRSDDSLVEYLNSYGRQGFDTANYVERQSQDGTSSLFEHVSNYEKYIYDQPISVQVRPTEQSWSSNVDYHEDSWGKMSSYNEPAYPVENNFYNQHSEVQLEPYEPTWSRDLRYDKSYQENLPPQFHHCNTQTEFDTWSAWPFQYD